MKQSLHTSLWSIHDMRLVPAGPTLGFAGDAVALVALMLRVSAEGGPGALSALLLAFALPSVAAIPVAGWIVDRNDSRTVLVAAGGLLVAGSAAAPRYWSTRAPSPRWRSSPRWSGPADGRTRVAPAVKRARTAVPGGVPAGNDSAPMVPTH